MIEHSSVLKNEIHRAADCLDSTLPCHHQQHHYHRYLPVPLGAPSDDIVGTRRDARGAEAWLCLLPGRRRRPRGDLKMFLAPLCSGFYNFVETLYRFVTFSWRRGLRTHDIFSFDIPCHILLHLNESNTSRPVVRYTMHGVITGVLSALAWWNRGILRIQPRSEAPWSESTV